MCTEREFVERLRQRFPVFPPVRVGIGDDGAVLDCIGQQQVVVTDMLLDGVHFDLADIGPSLVGRKAVAVNLSDLAAMAARPTAAFVSLALPRHIRNSQQIASSKFLEQLYDGIAELTREFQFTLAGGDTNSWNGPFAINVCLTGTPFLNRPVLRSGARPGDILFVSGALGGSLQSGRHLSFTPRLMESEWLIENIHLHAMMDLSDGLSIDLNRLAKASNVGATVIASDIPVHADVSPQLPAEKRLQSALNDGEDFELLFCVSRDEGERLLEMQSMIPFPVRRIGRIESGADCWLQATPSSSSRIPLDPGGWEHRL